MKETNKKTVKQLDEKELEQVTGGAGETEGNKKNPTTTDTQSDGEPKTAFLPFQPSTPCWVTED